MQPDVMQPDVLEQEVSVNVTDSAGEVVRQLLLSKNVPDYGLRVFVSGGGCSGMQYGMALEAEPRPYDHIVEKEGYRIFIDPTSMMYLENATIDYQESMIGGGFKIDNPNAASSCGCGTSFKAQNGPAAPAAGGGCSCGA